MREGVDEISHASGLSTRRNASTCAGVGGKPAVRGSAVEPAGVGRPRRGGPHAHGAPPPEPIDRVSGASRRPSQESRRTVIVKPSIFSPRVDDPVFPSAASAAADRGVFGEGAASHRALRHPLPSARRPSFRRSGAPFAGIVRPRQPVHAPRQPAHAAGGCRGRDRRPRGQPRSSSRGCCDRACPSSPYRHGTIGNSISGSDRYRSEGKYPAGNANGSAFSRAVG